MSYKQSRARMWVRLALSQKNTIVKFMLLYIALEVAMKPSKVNVLRIEPNSKIATSIRYRSIRCRFFQKIPRCRLTELRHNLDHQPLKNMKTDKKRRDDSAIRLASEYDFNGIIKFVQTARNNIAHGDKSTNRDRDLDIAQSGITILEPLVDVIIDSHI